MVGKHLPTFCTNAKVAATFFIHATFHSMEIIDYLPVPKKCRRNCTLQKVQLLFRTKMMEFIEWKTWINVECRKKTDVESLEPNYV